MNTKRIIAITTITTFAAAGLANAQTGAITEAQKSVFQQAMSLFHSGKSEDAKKLLTENGLKTFEAQGKTRINGRGMMENMHDGMKNGMHMKGDRKAIEAAIIAGNFTNFQAIASSSPLKNITESTFNLLVPQFQARKNAHDQIRNVLTSAGIQAPENK